MTARYAIYFAPPAGSPLEAFGRAWLGRDHVGGAPLAQPEVEGLAAARLAEITRSPRHYGFHATLKAPFALAPGGTQAALREAAAAFAARQAPFTCPPLQVADVSGFTAFILSAPAPAMDALAASCVRAFERFRAPLAAAELAQRRQSGLSPRQDQYLVQFGYPYVFEDFQFHMTLSERLAEPERGLVLAALRARTAALTRDPLPCAAISLYVQPARSAPFTLLERLPFGGR